MYSRSWPFSGIVGQVSCKIAYVARDVCKFASIFTLALLSVDRCLASYHHLGSLRTIGVGKTAVAVIWIACAVIAAPYLTYAGIRGPSSTRKAASCRLVWPSHLITVYTAFQCLLGLVVPSTIVLAAYAILFRRLRLIRSRMGQATRVVTRPSRRMLRTILVVVVTFVVCQTPYHSRPTTMDHKTVVNTAVTEVGSWPQIGEWPHSVK